MDNQQELKAKLLEMFSWFHDFCEKNQLRYYAVGGTMLGAVRHQGFIPWDDDIDVGMPREDYERLATLLKEEDRYVLETPKTADKDYFYPFSKLYDTTTTLIENTKYKIKRGIYIDIFPLDGIGDTKEEVLQNYASVSRKHNLLLLKVAGIRKGRKFYKNLGVLLFRFIPINAKKLLKKVDEACSKYKFDEKKYVANLVGAWGEREIVPRATIGTPTTYQFEGLKIYGVEKADEYLTSLYGDWRKLPPPEKQVSHHDFIKLDLRSSYKK